MSPPDLRVPSRLPNPVGALRERLRSIAHAVGETRHHVAEARAALSSQIEVLGAEIGRTQAAEARALSEQIEALSALLRSPPAPEAWGRAEATALESRLVQLEAVLTAQHAESARVREILRSICDREPSQRERLRGLRESDGYLPPFTEATPLVSVVIPTFDNHLLLRERAIPSILGQTYQHFEVVVVGDAAPSEARAAVESFGDARLRYSNLPYRGPYPPDPVASWHVAGVPPYNEAVRLARGHWIAPLDDDDAFRSEHIERLLETAQRERLELVYGTILERHPDGTSAVLGRFPPDLGQFGLQAAIYHAGVAAIFELELTDWLFELPYDWGLCQRMLRSGVRMRMIDEIGVEYFPSQRWTPREPAEPTEPGEPANVSEWEFVPEGWERASDDDQPCSRGWDVDDVALAYTKHWPAFCAAVSAPRPLGVAHELTPDAEMSNASPVAHNTAVTLAYVLARAARPAGALSVLDWGGGLGHQYAIALSALPEIEFDWHTRELPAVCHEGRRASPTITFHDSDGCLDRSYNVVLASGSFQYSEDWRRQLSLLSHASQDSLLITRLPLVESEPSFVVLQRAQAYGYATEYLGWVFNRTEFLDAAAAAGLKLEREFVLDGPMNIAGAPESPSHGAFLFKPNAS